MDARKSLRPARRRLALLVSTLAALTLLISACAGGGQAATGGSGAKDSADLTFWTINLKKQFSEYINGLITQYQGAHPGVHITWVDVPGQDIATKLLSAIASGEVPDVVNVDSANLGRFSDKMTDLSTLVPKDSLADFQPGLLKSLQYNGNTLTALPWYNGGAPVGIYNLAVMKKVGFDPAKPPTTYDQVLALAQKVYDTTKVYGTNEIPSYINGATAVLSYEGIPLLSADKKKAAFNTPEAVAVLEKYKKFYDSHAIAPGAISADIRNFPETVDNGRIGFQADSFPYVLTPLKTNAPSVYSSLAITKAPATADGKYLLLGQQTLAVPKASKHQAAAADFAGFVTNGANQLAFCKIVAIYPSTISSTKDSFFTSEDDKSPLGQARKVILEELPNLVDGQLGTGKDAELSDDLSKQVRSFMQGTITAPNALSAAADAWNTALAGS